MAKMTLDSLAVMIQKQFSAQDDKFDGLKKEIGSVRTELKNEISTQIGSLRSEFRSEFKQIKEDLSDIKQRLTRIEKRTFEDDNALAGEVDDLRKRVKILEKRLGIT